MASVTGYKVLYRACTATPKSCTQNPAWGSWNSSTHTAATTSTTITGLTNGTAYQVRVQATSSVGDGAWLQSTATPSTKPATPAPTVSAGKVDGRLVGSGNLEVSWTAPNDGGSAITGYKIQWKSGTQQWSTSRQNTDTASPNLITGLTNGTAYTVRVLATNAIGDSAWSQAKTATPATKPAQPSAPTVSVPTTGNDGQRLSVTWTAPTNDGGSAITGYDVQYKTSTASDWTDKSHTGTGTSTTITGLTQGTAYNVQVRATNSVGDSAWSSGTGTPATAPGKPTSVAVSVPTTGNDGQRLSVTWTAPTNDGGSVITGYKIQWKSDTQQWNPSRQNTDTASPNLITGLTNGTAYTVRVLATNAIGDSTPSATATATPATKPPAPTGVTVTGGVSVGSGRLNVSWTAPTSNTSGLPITDYDVQYRPCTGTPTECAGETPPWRETWSTWDHSGTGTTTAITGLTNGTAYQVQVRSVNGVGGSVWTPTTPVEATPKYKPSTPGAPSVVGGKSGNTLIGSGRLKVSWTAPSDDGGSSITGYDLRYRVCTSSSGLIWYYCAGSNKTWTSWTTWKHNPITSDTTTIIDGLANGYAVQVQVRAKSSLGNSGWSESGRGVSVTTPLTPYHDGTDETTGGGTTLKLRYCTKGTTTTCYVDDHGDAQITYHYYWKQCGASQTDAQCKQSWPATNATPNYSKTWSQTPKLLKKSITGLTQGKKYAMSVKACNSVGCSDYADPVLGTPHTVPGTPTLDAVRWSTLGGDNVLLVDWSNPSDNGGKSLDGFDIFYCNHSASECAKNPFATNSQWTRVACGTTTPSSDTRCSRVGDSDPLAYVRRGYTTCQYWIHLGVKNSAGYGPLSARETTSNSTTAC